MSFFLRLRNRNTPAIAASARGMPIPTPMPMPILSEVLRPLDCEEAVELELVTCDVEEVFDWLVALLVAVVVPEVVEINWPCALTVLFVRLKYELPTKAVVSPGT